MSDSYKIYASQDYVDSQSFSGSYNDLTEKPFCKSIINIEYDGSLENKQVININGNHNFVKVSNLPTLNEVHSIVLQDISVAKLNNLSNQYDDQYNCWIEDFEENDNYIMYYIVSDFNGDFDGDIYCTIVLIAKKDCVIDNVSFERGIWIDNSSFNNDCYFVSNVSVDAVNQIDNQYISSHVIVVMLTYAGEDEDGNTKYNISKSFDEILKLIAHGNYVVLCCDGCYYFLSRAYDDLLDFSDTGEYGCGDTYSNAEDENGNQLQATACEGITRIIIYPDNTVRWIYQKPLTSFKMLSRGGKVFNVEIDDSGNFKIVDQTQYYDISKWCGAIV